MSGARVRLHVAGPADGVFAHGLGFFDDCARFGVLEQHVGKAADLKTFDQPQLNAAEWELTQDEADELQALLDA